MGPHPIGPGICLTGLVFFFVAGRWARKLHESERHGWAAAVWATACLWLIIGTVVSVRELLEDGLRLHRRKKKEEADNDAERPLHIVSHVQDGFVKCPGCGVRFALYSGDFWDGTKHVTCGTRIMIEKNPPPEQEPTC